MEAPNRAPNEEAEDHELNRDLVQLAAVTLERIGAHSSGTKPTYVELPPDPRLGDLLPISVPYKPVKADLKHWREEGYHPVWAPGSKRHPHSLIGAGRALCEYELVRLIRARSASLGRSLRVADVGSNADRLRTVIHALGAEPAFGTLHHLIPVIQGGDSLRLINARGKYPHCTCRFEACTHVDDFDVYLFQHSLYYFDPDALCRLLPAGCTALASVHHIFDAAGSICDNQMVYHIDDTGNAVCVAQGNTHAYVHPTNGWLTLTQWVAHGKRLLWDCTRTIFGSHVYVFHIEAYDGPALPQAPSPFATHDYAARLTKSLESATALRALGPGQTASADIHLERVTRVTFRFGVPLVYHDGDRCTAVPRDLIGVLQSKAAGVPRNGTLERTLFELAKRYLSTGNMPPERIARVSLIAVCAALVRDVEQETAQLGRLHATHRTLFDEHARVVAGGELRAWRWWMYLDLRNAWACCRIDEHRRDEAAAFHSLRASGVAPTPAKPVTVVAKYQPTHGRKTKVAPPLAVDSHVEVFAETQPPPPNPTVTLRLISLGPVMPTVAKAGVESFVHAFTARIGKAVPESDELVWRNLALQVLDSESHLHGLYLEPVEPSPADRAAWLEKFPANQREKFVAAIEELKHRELMPSDFRGSAMIKVEKSGMCTGAGEPDIDERLVIAYKPQRQVVTGVYDWLIAKQLRANYSPDPDNPVLWVNGPAATAEAFGQWYTSHYNAIRGKWGAVFVYKGDQSRFEAHRDQHSFGFSRDVSFRAVADRRYRLAVEASVWLRGRAQRHDVRYKAKYKLGSGGTETSKDSFIRNLCGATVAFGPYATGDQAGAFNGDDWITLRGFRITPDAFHRRMLQCGFESDFEECLRQTDVEFCQTLPWPVGDGIVWGPKPGRVLSRLPWCTSASRDADPRGIALGMLKSCNHIPFLRVYLRHVAQHSPDATAVEYKYHIAAVESHEADDATWAFCFDRYGLTQHDEEEFASLLAGVPLQSAIDWPHLAHMYEVDL